MSNKLTFEIKGDSQGMMTKVESRAHSFIIDEPASFGGQDTGPDPLSTLLGALISCENVIANMVAKEIGFNLQGITFQVTGDLDLRGLMGNESVRTYFEKVTINARLKTDETEEKIKAFQEMVDKRCPIYQTLKAANVELISKWVKA